MVVFVLRFTEPGGVTVPSRSGPEPRAERLQVELDTGPDGQPQLPGTSLAGALREQVRAQRGDAVANLLFGTPLGVEDEEARASKIWVLGGELLGDGVVTERRAAAGIDRARGAAARHMLRTDEVLPVGARFEVFLRWEDASEDDLADFTGLLARWTPLIGRGVSRGRGRCVVDEVRYGTLPLDNAGDLLVWLTSSGPELIRRVATLSVLCEPAGDSEPVFRGEVTITGPWHTGSGVKPKPGSKDPIPMFRSGGDLVVPGASMKGVFRSRAEFIVRSVGIEPQPCVDQRCGKCWTCRVFGYGGGEDESAGAVGARSVIRFPDSVIDGAVTAERVHVAIDRFTGGALDQALYTMEGIEDGTFEIRADPVGELTENCLREIRAVFRLVVQDLNDGIIGMGAGAARGYGSVTVTVPEPGWPNLAEAQQLLVAMGTEGSPWTR